MSHGVVWFKRDFRVVDHAALSAAARAEPIMRLFVIEPSPWAQPDVAAPTAILPAALDFVALPSSAPRTPTAEWLGLDGSSPLQRQTGGRQ